MDIKQGIIVECKNRQMRSITGEMVNEWVLELQNMIECAHSAPEFKQLNFDSEISTGLLLVHANDSYDATKWANILRGIQMRIKRTRMSIYVASNEQIDMWQALFDYMKGLDGNKSFVYPSINQSNSQSTDYVTINSLFSKYIFAEQIYEVSGSGSNGLPMTECKRNRVIFCCDVITIETFQYLWSMFKEFQFADHLVSRYIFVFYPRKDTDVRFVRENFIKSIERGIAHPIDPRDKEKIQLEFLRNRLLSPVDN